ncbi:MAG: hypothetical protein ACLVGW_03485 [Evtepia gabavorous]
MLLLEEKRRANSPSCTPRKGAHAATAESVLKPMGARQYPGLWRMAALSNCFCGPGRPATGGIRAREKVQARELRDRMEAQIAPAAQELAGILVRTTSR